MATASIPFRRVFHADWSVAANKRWVAEAIRTDTNWQAAAPRLVGDTREFVDGLFAAAGPVLAGFDFPIGLPVTYGHLTGLGSFPAALGVFGQSQWSGFFNVADTPEQISLNRPFYPRVSKAGSKRYDLLRGLGIEDFNALRRHCDRATTRRRAACPVFWTLGGNQVGKAAISGWQEIVAPARLRGAGLWPFDGTLAELAQTGRPVIAETYPAEAYHHVGVTFRPNMSKQRQADRRSAMAGLFEWAHRNGVIFQPELAAQICNGFGDRKAGEDPFDAVAGMLGMIEVLDGRRSEGRIERGFAGNWEGWILGQTASPIQAT